MRRDVLLLVLLFYVAAVVNAVNVAAVVADTVGAAAGGVEP